RQDDRGRFPALGYGLRNAFLCRCDNRAEAVLSVLKRPMRLAHPHLIQPGFVARNWIASPARSRDGEGAVWDVQQCIFRSKCELAHTRRLIAESFCSTERTMGRPNPRSARPGHAGLT